MWILSFLLLSVDAVCFGQTFGEFFNQKKTQKRYLLEQVAALQVYIGYARKGYELVGSGLHAIQDLSNGEFSLHSAFISSLKQVNPFIRDNMKALEIVASQMEIVRSFRKIDRAGMLSVSHWLYIQSVRAVVLGECGRDLEELLLVISPGLVELDDAERMARLDRLYAAMQEKFAFTQVFCFEVESLVAGKQKELRNVEDLVRAYGILE